MLVFVPQGFVVLVHAGGRLVDVLEAGVGVVDGQTQLQYVYLPQAQAQPEPVDEEEFL